MAKLCYILVSLVEDGFESGSKCCALTSAGSDSSAVVVAGSMARAPASGGFTLSVECGNSGQELRPLPAWSIETNWLALFSRWQSCTCIQCTLDYIHAVTSSPVLLFPCKTTICRFSFGPSCHTYTGRTEH